MTISPRLQAYLQQQAVAFDEVPHAHSVSASAAAEAAHVSGNHLAKGVVLRTHDGFVVAAVPASRRVRLDALRDWLGDDVELAVESEIDPLFADCERGAVPPIGAAYGLDTIVDDSLLNSHDIYFEGGDHLTLVHLSADDWRRMTSDAPHRAFSSRPSRA